MHIQSKPLSIVFLGLLACALACIVVWPLHHGIAIRNIGLVTGTLLCIPSLAARLVTKDFRPSLTPILLFLLFSWLIIQAFFISSSPTASFSELFSLWLRCALALVIGVRLGVLSRNSGGLSKAILFALIFVYFFEYFFGFLDGTELAHIPFDGFYKSKAAAAYFLLFPFLIICGFIDSLLQHQEESGFHAWLQLIFAFLILLACIFGAFYSGSLNGLLMMALSGLVLLIRIGFPLLSSQKNIRWFVLSAAVFFIFFTSLFILYSKNDSKLSHFMQDASLGIAIDTYPNWRNEDLQPWVPQAADGHPVNQSTYYRIANFIHGVRLIEQHPLGAGFTWLPYGFYMKQLYPNSQSDHTHSGWVDFTLGVGIPGLLLLWLAILNTIRLGVQTIRRPHKESEITQLWGYVTVWLIGGIFIAWFFNEVSEREYIEQLFFIIALFSGGNTPTSNAAQAKTIPHT
jgi:hypothetical protein